MSTGTLSGHVLSSASYWNACGQAFGGWCSEAESNHRHEDFSVARQQSASTPLVRVSCLTGSVGRSFSSQPKGCPLVLMCAFDHLRYTTK